MRLCHDWSIPFLGIRVKWSCFSPASPYTMPCRMAGIELAHVSKIFPGDVTAVDDVTLSIADGQFLVLVGPSGCGKSTLLRMIAGLEEGTDGRLSIGGREVTDFAPRQRDIT